MNHSCSWLRWRNLCAATVDQLKKNQSVIASSQTAAANRRKRLIYLRVSRSAHRPTGLSVRTSARRRLHHPSRLKLALKLIELDGCTGLRVSVDEPTRLTAASPRRTLITRYFVFRISGSDFLPSLVEEGKGESERRQVGRPCQEVLKRRGPYEALLHRPL